MTISVFDTTREPAIDADKYTIVFVDDEAGILSTLRSLFHREGYHIEMFGNGQEAVDYLVRHPANVIVTDMRMPGMSGLALLERATISCPEASRIILSGFEDREVVMNALVQGLAHQYILKPWDNASFLALVRKTILFQQELRRRHLEDILGKFHSLPAPIRSYETLRLKLARSENTLPILVAEVEKSPPLVAKVLRVANSVFFGSRRPIESVHDAVVFIGVDYVMTLILAHDVFSNICKECDELDRSYVEGLWDTSIRRATIARQIAADWPGITDAHVPYAVALLQDVGLIVRVCFDHEKYRRYREVCAQSEMSAYEAEATIFAVSHEEVGRLLLESWNFPAEFSQAVGIHHGIVTNNPIAAIIQISDVLEGGGDDHPHDPALDEAIARWRLKITTSTQS